MAKVKHTASSNGNTQNITVNVRNTSIIKIIVAGLVIAAVLVYFFFTNIIFPAPNDSEILSVSNLERIVFVSELSTFESVYSGVVEVRNDDRPENIDYYVSYKSSVKAVIDFEQITFSLDEENKVLTVSMPSITISASVNPDSLDYLFYNDRANSLSVSADALSVCTRDVVELTRNEDSIHNLARQNAENTIKAFLLPLINQTAESYTVDFLWEGQNEEV